jgi:mannosyltransferase OCH1-like enzyme
MNKWLYSLVAASIVGSIACVIWSNLQHTASFHYVDFDISMKLPQHTDKLTPGWGAPIMKVFKFMYELNNAKKVAYDPQLRIPRIIHQIWLGSPLPEQYHAWQATWKQYHPDWEYHLWTDADIEPLRALGDFFIGDTYAYYQQATNYGERSDILKILLIHYYGGLYVDTDFECLRSCEILHHYYDMYIGIQPLDVAYVQLGYALFAAYPRHPFIKKVIDTLHTTRHYPEIVRKTGPLMITECFAQHAPSMSHRLVALPASYFYPRGYSDPIEPRSQWVQPESFAVHHWAGSWLDPKANVNHNSQAAS